MSAHDNYTLWDKLKLSDPKRKEDAEPDFDKMDERTLSMNRLAAGIVMTCKGMPFSRQERNLRARSMAKETASNRRGSSTKLTGHAP